MNQEHIRRQLIELDFPNLCRFTLTVEVHPRCIALCNDGKEYAVTVHEMLSKRARVYYHGSKVACMEAYKALMNAISLEAREAVIYAAR